MPPGHSLAKAAQSALRFANELRFYNDIRVFGVLDQRSQGQSVPQVAGTGLGIDPCIGVARLAADAGRNTWWLQQINAGHNPQAWEI